MNRRNAQPPRVGVCITGQLGRLELAIKLSTILRPLADATGTPLDVALILDGSHNSTQAVDITRASNSHVDPTVALFHDNRSALHALRRGRSNTIREIVLREVVPTTRGPSWYIRKLGRKPGISIGARAAIHAHQFELLAECWSALNQVSGKRRHDVFVRLREDVVSPQRLPATQILSMLREATANKIAAVVTSGLEVMGGINDKAAFLNEAAARDFFLAPLDYFKAPIITLKNVTGTRRPCLVNGHQLNPETLLCNFYRARNLSLLTVPNILFSPLRLRGINQTCVTGCAKVCHGAAPYCLDGPASVPDRLWHQGRELARGATDDGLGAVGSMRVCGAGTSSWCLSQ